MGLDVGLHSLFPSAPGLPSPFVRPTPLCRCHPWSPPAKGSRSLHRFSARSPCPLCPPCGHPARSASPPAEGAHSRGTKVRVPSRAEGPETPPPSAAAGAPRCPARRRPHLFLQRLLGRERRLGGGRAVADAALQQVEPGGPRARVALEVEEQVLQQCEPLGLPFCVVRTPFAQVAFARAVLARQQPQGRDVAIVQPDPLLHGARRPAGARALTSPPRRPGGPRPCAPPLPSPQMAALRALAPPPRPGQEMPRYAPPVPGKLRERGARGRGAGGVM